MSLLTLFLLLEAIQWSPNEDGVEFESDLRLKPQKLVNSILRIAMVYASLPWLENIQSSCSHIRAKRFGIRIFVQGISDLNQCLAVGKIG